MRLALTDPLTGLGNHRHFHDRLERELADSRAQGYPLSLCLVDIDDFKRINDRFGHPGRRQGARAAGDEPPPGRRGVPARRRRVRDPAARDATRKARAIAAEAIVERIADRRAGARRARHGQRRHRDRAGGGARPRRARPPRRQRALLGEGVRQEPGAGLPARRGRDRRAEAARGRARPGGALPRRGEPRQSGRRARRLHGLALGARRRPRGPDRDPPRRRSRSRSS